MGKVDEVGRKRQLQSNPVVLQYISGSEKDVKVISEFLRKFMERYDDTFVRKEHIDRLIEEIWGKLDESRDIKFRRDLERLGLIERYNEEGKLIRVYDKEWLRLDARKHKFKLSLTGKAIAKVSNDLEKTRQYIVISFLYFNEVMRRIIDKMVKEGVCAVPVDQAIKDSIIEISNDIKDEKIRRRFEQLLGLIDKIKETISKVSRICSDIIELEVKTQRIRVNLSLVKQIGEEIGVAITEISVSRYIDALTSALAEYWKDFAKEIFGGKWLGIPETSLESIYERINEFLGIKMTLKEHVEMCKRLSNLGYIGYSYGGISVVKGQKADEHWIEMKKPMIRKFLEKLMEITGIRTDIDKLEIIKYYNL